ncbi:hypothetical protein GCM10009601_34090 [Streptomyces thermospinosisporus]|uniref:Uncharacterized protein n=1 Tax=Streptomyces thermospinosisporus TaxID=161482 RepID=A0ABN1YZJ6_9ACTN
MFHEGSEEPGADPPDGEGGVEGEAGGTHLRLSGRSVGHHGPGGTPDTCRSIFRTVHATSNEVTVGRTEGHVNGSDKNLDAPDADTSLRVGSNVPVDSGT